MSKPQFQHDCERCTFHGRFQGHDVYTCQSSVIARFGSDGPEYKSFPEAVASRLPADSFLRQVFDFTRTPRSIREILSEALPQKG